MLPRGHIREISTCLLLATCLKAYTLKFQDSCNKLVTEHHITQADLDAFHGFLDDAKILATVAKATWKDSKDYLHSNDLVWKLFGQMTEKNYEAVGEVISDANEFIASPDKEVPIECEAQGEPGHCMTQPGGLFWTNSGDRSNYGMTICWNFWQLQGQGFYNRRLPNGHGDTQLCGTAPRFSGQWYGGLTLFHELLHQGPFIKWVRSGYYDSSTDTAYGVGSHDPSPKPPSPNLKAPSVLGLSTIFAADNPDSYAWFAFLLQRRKVCGWTSQVPENPSKIPFYECTVLKPDGLRDPVLRGIPSCRVPCTSWGTPTIDTVKSTVEGSFADVLYCFIGAPDNYKCPDGWIKRSFKVLSTVGDQWKDSNSCVPPHSVDSIQVSAGPDTFEL